MADDFDGPVDLFGLPLLPEKGVGRPAHRWTLENSNKVNILFACGRTPVEVARALGISRPTFYKHYFNEIGRREFAQLALRGVQMARLNAEAAKGNVAAEKALAAMVQAERVAVMSDRVKDRGAAEPRPTKGEPVGKKEQAKRDAESMGGLYATRTPPEGATVQ